MILRQQIKSSAMRLARELPLDYPVTADYWENIELRKKAVNKAALMIERRIWYFVKRRSA